jgi:hypothetical protein
VKEYGALQLTPRPSGLIAAWLTGLHAATLVPLWWSALPLWPSAAIASAIAIHGMWAVRRFGQLRSPRSVIGITLQPDGRCAFATRAGAVVHGSVDVSTVVLGSVVMLAVKGSPGHPARRVIIARDMLAEDDFRRLRLALKWGGTQKSRDPQV